MCAQSLVYVNSVCRALMHYTIQYSILFWFYSCDWACNAHASNTHHFQKVLFVSLYGNENDSDFKKMHLKTRFQKFVFGPLKRRFCQNTNNLIAFLVETVLCKRPLTCDEGEVDEEDLKMFCFLWDWSKTSPRIRNTKQTQTCDEAFHVVYTTNVIWVLLVDIND